MKPVYLFISSLLVAGTLSAQKFDLMFSRGVGINTEIQNLMPFTNIFNEKGKPPHVIPTYSIKGVYHVKQWQIGLSVERRTAAYRTFRQEHFEGMYSSTGMTQQEIEIESAYKNQLSYVTATRTSFFPVKLQVNRKITVNRFETYAGLSAGYIIYSGTLFSRGSTIIPEKNRATEMIPLRSTSDCGTSLGFQVGSYYSLSKHFLINAEVNADRITFQQGPVSKQWTNAACASIGFGYRF